jgi:glycosyltransferase involved in cell wall biosynthesis
MRLLIQHPHAAGEISGVLTSIQEMLAALSVHPELDVRVFSSKGQRLADQWRAVQWSDAVLLNSNALWMILFGRILRKKTLLKLHYPQYQTVHKTYEPMSFSKRMFVEIRHLVGLKSSASYILMSLARLVLRTAAALTADRVCACSRFCAEQASLPRDVAVLKNPLSVTHGLPTRAPDDLDRPYRFVFAGRISDEKGWDTLLDAAALLRERGHDFTVDLAGDGPEFDLLKARVASSLVTEQISVLGRLSATQVRERLVGALAVVIPSRFQEPAGYVALEAAAVQVAAIVSRVGGLPETAGADCPSFEPGEAEKLMQYMESFLLDPPGCLKGGRKSYLRVQQEFDPRLVAAQLLQLLSRDDLAKTLELAARRDGQN